MTTNNSVYDTEDILLALFDAHARIMQEKRYQLEKCETDDERAIVIDIFEGMSSEIAATACDWVQRNEDLLEERSNE